MGVTAVPPLPRPPSLFPVSELAPTGREDGLGTSKASSGQTDQTPRPAEQSAHGKSPRPQLPLPQNKTAPGPGVPSPSH